MTVVILGILITALTTWIGKKISDKYIYQEKFLNALNTFNGELIRNLAFRHDSIAKIRNKDFHFSDFNDFVSRVDFDGVIASGCPKYLDKDQRDAVISYFSGLGRNSLSAEKNFLEEYKVVFDDAVEKLRARNVKIKPLGIKIGFAIGIIIFILLL